MEDCELSREFVDSRLSYDATTGIFIWKKKPGYSREINRWNVRYSGKEAGTIREVGNNLFYRFINLGGKPIRAHQLAWLLTYGDFIRGLDHKDGDGLNNRIDNLRPLSHSDNIRKGRLRSNNTSGAKGVSLRADTGKWTARAMRGGVYTSLGCFDSKEDAVAAYREAVIEETGEFHP